jgi:tetratricopeptide (TPR) repeat protein
MSHSGQDLRIAELFRAAEQALHAGRPDEAARHWNQVCILAPGHPLALFHLGQHQLHGGNPRGARQLFEQAAAADPKNPVIALNISVAARALGDTAGEVAALDRALAIDPYFFPALLAKGMYFDRLGNLRQAAHTYKDALIIAPPEPEDWMRQPLARAREVVAQNTRELDAFIEQRLTGTRSARFNECKDLLTGAVKPMIQQPTLLNFPRLPAIPFYDRKDFPWLAEIEAATDTIRDELLRVQREDAGEFDPYVDHPDGVPLNQWAELNHSPRWSVFFLWSNGVRQDAHCVRCPKTAALLDAAPMARVPDAAPAAFFSVLAPKTLIPPHSGVTNTRLIVHIPLIVPEDCWFRVGNEKRAWKPGEALIFDDTIEHEAWNGSDKPRTILIFDIWNPYLDENERRQVCDLLGAYREYYGQMPG